MLTSRIIRGATHEAMADRNGMPTDDLFSTYQRLAGGCAGVIIVNGDGFQIRPLQYVEGSRFVREKQGGVMNILIEYCVV
jgi:2,4-dienoyl-CoA reductase-like NADH-dependent reductase (Old Yellow Enzyme family)